MANTTTTMGVGGVANAVGVLPVLNGGTGVTTKTGTGSVVLSASPTLSGTIGGNLTFSGNILVNGTFQAGGSNAFTIDSNGNATFMSNRATAGVPGVAAVFASTLQRTESASDANVLTLTPPAVAATYRLRFIIAVSASAAGTLGWTATWKDGNGAAQAPVNLALDAAGVAAPALTIVVAANGTYSGSYDIDIDNSATVIVIKLILGSGTFTGKASATIEELS